MGDRHPTGIGRFASDLPRVGDFVTLGEGSTPVIRLDRLARELGVGELWAKLETANPTGSYKDRVAAMSLSLARQRGSNGWIATSSGNAGLAMAAYGARAGLPGFLCLVASAPLDKRAPLLPFGSGLVAVAGIGDGGGRAAAAALREQVGAAADEHGLFLAITAHAFNPEGMRGIDTIGYELAEQVPQATCVYVPTGGGGLITAIGRGLALRGRTARLVACQPAGCAPIVQVLDGRSGQPVIERCESGISALQLPSPPDGPMAIATVRASRGWGTSMDDDAILAAQQRLARAEGVFVEPAAAAALAAVIADAESGQVGAHDQAVLVLTGAGWKDLARWTGGAGRIPTIGVGDVTGSVASWARSL